MNDITEKNSHIQVFIDNEKQKAIAKHSGSTKQFPSSKKKNADLDGINAVYEDDTSPFATEETSYDELQEN